jgi:hypothetical protein
MQHSAVIESVSDERISLTITPLNIAWTLGDDVEPEARMDGGCDLGSLAIRLSLERHDHEQIDV